MNDALHIDDLQAVPAADAGISASTPLTILTQSLREVRPDLRLAATAGRMTVQSFASPEMELTALLHGCGVYDLGWMEQVAVRGEDRVRWLSGMVTNAVQQLPEGEGNYSFLLNAQGRIQGDGMVYREAGQIILQTEAIQVQPLISHLDRFIIMDDVTLEAMGTQIGSIGVAGPRAAELLAMFAVVPPVLPEAAAAAFQPAMLCGIPLYVVTRRAVATPRYELWAASPYLFRIWNHLASIGAQPCGLEAVETLRVLEAVPRYGVDLSERDLPQETSQMRALNFSKGCYLGQEIVERIRSRGAVHKELRQFQLSGKPSTLPVELKAGETVVGRLSSAAVVQGVEGERVYAMGIVRHEALSHALTYNEGTATVLDRSPAHLI